MSSISIPLTPLWYANRACTDCDITPLSEYLWEKAIEREQYRAYSKRTDDWGKGAIGSATLPVYLGLCGEFALYMCASMLGLEVTLPDTQLLKMGDGGKDFLLGGVKVDVKTTKTTRNMVKQGRLGSDCYVFAEYNNSNGVEVVKLRGWQLKQVITKCPVRPGKGAWCNYEIPNDILMPMEDLILLNGTT